MSHVFSCLAVGLVCSTQHMGTTFVAPGLADDEWLRAEAMKYCYPQNVERTCRVLFIKRGAPLPNSVPLTESQAADVLMYFAVDRTLDFDKVRIQYNCETFPYAKADAPGRRSLCLDAAILNSYLAPYHYGWLLDVNSARNNRVLPPRYSPRPLHAL